MGIDIRTTLKNQYHASLWMLRQTIEKCPEDLWMAGENNRPFWRIAYHALFYGHWYLQPNSEDFTPWEHHEDEIASLWQPTKSDTVYSKGQILEYTDIVDRSVDAAIDRLDFDAESTGFDWYPNLSKLEHQIVTIRHTQQHAGQLSELLMARGIETDWRGGKPKN